MATYQHNIRLMANKTGDREVILVNQDESKSHEFNVKIFNTDDSAVAFPNLTNATLQIEKEDNTLAQVPMTSYTDGYFKFTPNVQAYTAGGDCNCFVQIISMRNGAQEDFIAGPFILRVQPTKFNRTVSDNDFAQIGQLVETAQGAESWAVGGTGTRPGEDANNAKYWSDRAQNAVGTSGTWTAELIGNNGAAITTSNNQCAYYIIGKLMWISFNITINSLGSATGLFFIGGLPRAVVNNDLQFPAGTYFYRLKTNFTHLYGSMYGDRKFLLRGTQSATTQSVSNVQISDLNGGGTSAGTTLMGSAILPI